MILKPLRRYNKRKSATNVKRRAGRTMHPHKVTVTGSSKRGPARAYILLQIVPGCSQAVVNTLLENQDVLAVDRVEGPPGIVAIIEAPSRTKLAAAVVKAVSTVEIMVKGVDLLPA
jgi:hypothetical protein